MISSNFSFLGYVHYFPIKDFNENKEKRTQVVLLTTILPHEHEPKPKMDRHTTLKPTITALEAKGTDFQKEFSDTYPSSRRNSIM
jgi:hypothetical protein